MGPSEKAEIDRRRFLKSIALFTGAFLKPDLIAAAQAMATQTPAKLTAIEVSSPAEFSRVALLFGKSNPPYSYRHDRTGDQDMILADSMRASMRQHIPNLVKAARGIHNLKPMVESEQAQLAVRMGIAARKAFIVSEFGRASSLLPPDGEKLIAFKNAAYRNYGEWGPEAWDEITPIEERRRALRLGSVEPGSPFSLEHKALDEMEDILDGTKGTLGKHNLITPSYEEAAVARDRDFRIEIARMATDNNFDPAIFDILTSKNKGLRPLDSFGYPQGMELIDVLTADETLFWKLFFHPISDYLHYQIAGFVEIESEAGIREWGVPPLPRDVLEPILEQRLVVARDTLYPVARETFFEAFAKYFPEIPLDKISFPDASLVLGEAYSKARIDLDLDRDNPEHNAYLKGTAPKKGASGLSPNTVLSAVRGVVRGASALDPSQPFPDSAVEEVHEVPLITQQTDLGFSVGTEVLPKSGEVLLPIQRPSSQTLSSPGASH